jgi:tetrahydromethanopterin S-methyltransferase subunit F
LLKSADAEVPSLQRRIWGGFHCGFVFSALLFIFPFCVYCFYFLL